MSFSQNFCKFLYCKKSFKNPRGWLRRNFLQFSKVFDHFSKIPLIFFSSPKLLSKFFPFFFIIIETLLGTFANYSPSPMTTHPLTKLSTLCFSAVDIESVVTQCCQEGNEWGSQRKHCNEYKFNLDKNVVPSGLHGLCLSTVEICCAKQHRIYQCTGEMR